MKDEGHKVWIVPDGWMPPEGGSGDMVNHESLMFLNTGKNEAGITLTLYFEDREYVVTRSITVGAGRIRAVRMDDFDVLGVPVPRATQYAIRAESNVPIFVQYGRMDVRQPNLAYYCTMAEAAD